MQDYIVWILISIYLKFTAIFFLSAVKIKQINNVKNPKKVQKTANTSNFMNFFDRTGVQKCQLITFVVAGGSQFLDENKENLMIYMFIVKIPHQTVLIAENSRFFHAFKPCLLLLWSGQDHIKT